MTENDRIVLSMVRSAVNGSQFDASPLKGKRQQEWSDIFRIASEQGVLALCYDIVNSLPTESRAPKPLHIRWALSAERIEKRYFSQLETARLIAEKFHESGIRFFILKGLAVSRYYPSPSKRECGDIDCFLAGDYDKGNEVAKSMGAEVDCGFYKHSHITYRGTLIENHRFCTAIRGSRSAKELEKHLQTLIADSQPEQIEGTYLMIPPADFNDVDWESVNRVLEQHDIKVFADAATAICAKYLGLGITNPRITAQSVYADRILDDIFTEQTRLYSSGFGKWKGRAMIVSNIVKNGWRYRQIYGHGIAGQLLRYAYGFIFERNPRLD